MPVSNKKASNAPTMGPTSATSALVAIAEGLVAAESGVFSDACNEIGVELVELIDSVLIICC